MGESEIQHFYDSKVIFVTGATGFLGKVLVEKLLRSTKVSKIYMLARKKKGLSPLQRLQNILNSPLFHEVKKVDPSALERIAVLEGDSGKPRLGLEDNSLQILYSQVEVVFHSAANVRFNAGLCEILPSNVQSVLELLNICKNMKKLQAVVHLSTAYLHCQSSHTTETVLQVVPPPAKVFVNHLVKNFTLVAGEEDYQKSIGEDDQKRIMEDDIVNGYLGSRPNNYVFSKALAEQILAEERENLPVCIVRPSIIVPTLKEPFPGWVDNMNGPTGLFIIAGTGYMRTAVIDEDMKVNGVPVDICANLLIVAAAKTAHDSRVNINARITVYNNVAGNTASISWKRAYQFAWKALTTFPFDNMIWYPDGSFQKSKPINAILEFLLHTIPAHLVDLVQLIRFREPFAVRLCHKMHSGVRLLDYFMLREWSWDTENVDKLLEWISGEDRNTFNFDLQDVDFEQYFENYVKGIRRYILKQEDNTVPAARRKLRILYILHLFLRFIMAALFYRVVTGFLSIFISFAEE